MRLFFCCFFLLFLNSLFAGEYFFRHGEKIFVTKIVFSNSNFLPEKNLKPYLLNNSSTVLLTKRLFVKIDSKLSDKQLILFLKKNNLKFIKRFRHIPWILVSTKENAITKSRFLVENHIFEEAEPSFYTNLQLKSVLIPNDTYFSKQWYLFNDGKNFNLSGDDSCHVASAWAVLKKYAKKSNNKIKLAIIDDGFDLVHEDLKDKFIEGYDFLEKDSKPEYGKYNFHGTCCAGIAGASFNNRKGISGACPKCEIMPVRLNLNALTLDSAVIESFEFVFDKNADIVSCSWGPMDNSGPAEPGQPLKDLIKKMATSGRNKKGIIIVFASGNGNESISDSKSFDGYASNSYVFAIGATDASGKKASYSDFGKDLDFVVSSSGIDVSGEIFDGIWTTDLTIGGENEGEQKDKNDDVKILGDKKGLYFSEFGGTSASAPLASGIIGLVLFANPNLSRDEVYEILKETADKSKDVNFDDNGFSIYYGYGRLNACRAVKKALKKRGIVVDKNACDETVEIEEIDDETLENDNEFIDTDNFMDNNSGCGCNIVF